MKVHFGNPSVQNGIKVLILEDNLADAELLEDELRQAGFAFLPKRVKDRKDYMKALQDFHPDLILSDYALPSFSGWEALQIKKQMTPETPFILVTGAVGEERAIEVLTGGATDYVLKKNISRLFPAVRRALQEEDEHRKRKEAEAERDKIVWELERRVRERTEALESEIAERKRAEEYHERLLRRVGEVRRRFEAVVENSPVGICVWRGPDLVYELINPAYQLLAPGKQFIGKTFAEAWPEVLDPYLPVIKGVMNTGEPHCALNEMVRIKKSEGGSLEDRFFNSFFTALPPDDSGQPGVMNTVVEITDLVRVSEGLRESEEKYRSVIETMDEGFGLCEIVRNVRGQAVDYRYLEINRALERQTGLLRDRTQGRQATHVFPGLDKSWIETYARVADKNEPAHFERYWAQLGRWFEVSAFPYGGDRFIFFYSDITERRQADQDLVESEEKYRELVETANSIIMKVNQSGKITFFNAYAQKFFGYTPEEMLGADMRMFIPEAESTSGRSLEAIIRTLLSHPDHLAESINENIKKNGERVWISWRNKGTRGPDGRVSGFLAIGQDITEHKWAEEKLKERSSQLENANKELESFSYSVSHDLRAPLRAVEGFLSMLMKTLKMKLDEEERRKFDLVRDNAQKMNQLIDDLLSLSRISRTELICRPVDMNNLVESVWRQQLEAEPEISADLKLGDLPAVFGDRNLLFQVLSNLIGNAVKYSKKRKKALIEISGEDKGKEQIFCVKDNGAGFDMKYYDKLFSVFQRLHSESEYEGTGVGLAIVQRIIHRHGGRVWAEGKVGKGAAFYFALPGRRSSGAYANRVFRGR